MNVCAAVDQKGQVVTTRCGRDTSYRRGDVTAWESNVTCPYCLSRTKMPDERTESIRSLLDDA